MPKGQKKTPKIPSPLRAVLAVNVRALMDAKYRESGNKPKALAKDAGVSLSTVQRMLSQESGATIDTIDSVAKVFGVSIFELLTPGFAGTPANPRHDRFTRKRPGGVERPNA